MADLVLTGPFVVSSPAFTASGITAVAVTAGQWVYKDSATSDKLRLADADAQASAQVVGMAVSSAAAGEICTYAINGASVTQVGTTGTKGQANYASVTAGSMADAMPASTKWSTILGQWLSTTVFKVNIQIGDIQVA